MSKRCKRKKLKRYPNIMADICGALEQNQIACIKSQSEVIVVNSNKKSIKKALSPLIDKNEQKILLEIVGVRNDVYIRKRYA